jgi:hypothetical protein
MLTVAPYRGTKARATEPPGTTKLKSKHPLLGSDCAKVTEIGPRTVGSVARPCSTGPG